MSDLSHLAAQALAEAKASPKAGPWWVAPALVSLALAVLTAAMTLAMAQSPESGRSTLHAFVAFALLTVVVVGLFLVHKPGPSLPRSLTSVATFACAVALVGAGSGVDLSASLVEAGVPCARAEVLLSLLPGALLLWLLTRVAFSTSRAVLAGATAGALGALVLHFHCCHGSVAHLALFHVLPWLAVTGLVVLVRRALPSHTFAP